MTDMTTLVSHTYIDAAVAYAPGDGTPMRSAAHRITELGAVTSVITPRRAWRSAPART